MRRSCTAVLAAAAALTAVGVAPAQAPELEIASVSSGEKPGNDRSGRPQLSRDGRYVAFSSLASNLVPRDTNRVRDVFVRDRRSGRTRRVSVSSAGAQGNLTSQHAAISANGRWVA